MSLTRRAAAVRARVTAGAGVPLLGDALTLDLLAGGPVSRERLTTSWRDTAALAALATAKRAPLEPALAAAMLEQHRRLGASPASLANLERLARGEAVAAVSGQQPGPLGGPLYALHKTAGTVGLAVEVARRTGVPCVPLFWMHGEDSDFTEIRGITVADADLQLHDLQLPDAAHRDGGLVGSVTLESVRALGEAALGSWSGLAGHAEVAGLWQRALERSRDLGEVVIALWLALFAEQGLVVVDPRLPAFRAAARPILERYLADADTLHAAARSAGARMETLTGKRALSDASLDSFVFRIADEARFKVSAADARAAGAAMTLSPSVALRPAVQDGVFPTVAMACGPGEIAYLMQLREVFEGVGVKPAALAVRFGATWLPAPAVALADASGCEPWELVTHTDAVLARFAETRVPQGVHEALAAARLAVDQSMARLADESRVLDASLPQLIESARGKMDFQVSRLAEGVLGKARGRLDREQPAWRRLRYVLLPGDKLQERRLASLEPVARAGLGVIAVLCEEAAGHAASTADGVHVHHLLEV